MTSETQFDQNDLNIMAAYEELHPGSYNPAMAFIFAKEMGGSFDLLCSAAARYVTYDEGGYRAIGLPYIGKLRDAGFDRAVVRELFMELAFGPKFHDERHGHQWAFWMENRSFELFDTAEELIAVAKRFAVEAPERMIEHRDVLAEWLGRLRKPELKDRAAQVAAGLGEANWIMQMVVPHLGILEGEEQFEVIRQLPVRDQIRAARRVSSSHWGLVLKGLLLAQHQLHYGSADGPAVKAELADHCHRFPERAPAHLRWLAEGILRGLPDGDTDWFGFLLNAGWWRLFEDAGCRIAPLRAVPVPGGSVALEVTLHTKQGQIVLRHDPNGSRGEQLKAGDEVVVSAALIWQKFSQEDRSPDFRVGGRRGFNLELHAATRPTAAMFADKGRIFG